MSLYKKALLIVIIIILVCSSIVSGLDIDKTNQSELISGDDKYDLLIITYYGYANLLEPLAKHKDSVGIKTRIVTSYEIYRGKYFPVEGRDKQEKIKYFIKGAIEEWEIKYVLLVGSYRQIPVRYSYLETDYDTIPPEVGIDAFEDRFISDLYYADIYDENGSFCSWDSNENDIFGEWTRDNLVKDTVDLKPDVYLGRLACRNKIEARIVVNKIIDYEKNAYGQDWFNTIVAVGGDSFNDITYGTDFSEGEIITEKALGYMSSFNPIRFWISNGNLSTSRMWLFRFIKTLNQGAGFVYFSGHCNPGAWTTHPHADFETWLPFFRNRHVSLLYNQNRLPVLITECCHPCQFNVSIFDLNLLTQYWQFIPECWPWHMVRKMFGGSIASIGGTGYSITGIGDLNENDIPDCIESYDGWFNTHLFNLYTEEEIDFLGELLGKTLEDYVNNYPVYEDRHHCKVVEMKVLLGDPSLKIGGYPNNITDNDCGC